VRRSLCWMFLFFFSTWQSSFLFWHFPLHNRLNCEKEVLRFFISSPELKAQVSYFDRLLSVVRLFVCLSVNIYTFDFFSRTGGPILTKLGTNYSWGKGIHISSNEGDCPSPRGYNSKRVKIHWKYLKIFFSRASWPNSIKLATHYPCVKGIQVCSNKGPDPLQKGDNYKNVKMGWVF
jgi:hypothetical protein